jgi:hypothetical protein
MDRLAREPRQLDQSMVPLVAVIPCPIDGTRYSFVGNTQPWCRVVSVPECSAGRGAGESHGSVLRELFLLTTEACGDDIVFVANTTVDSQNGVASSSIRPWRAYCRESRSSMLLQRY